MVKSYGFPPLCQFSGMKCFFHEITFFFFFHGKIMFLQERKYFTLGKTLPEDRKMKLRSFFTLNNILGNEDAEYSAASLPFQQPAKEGNISLWAWLLSVSLGCSCQFYSSEITKVFSSRQEEEKFMMVLRKQFYFPELAMRTVISSGA